MSSAIRPETVLPARLLAVADAFAAMVRARPHRDPLRPEQAAGAAIAGSDRSERPRGPEPAGQGPHGAARYVSRVSMSSDLRTAGTSTPSWLVSTTTVQPVSG